MDDPKGLEEKLNKAQNMIDGLRPMLDQFNKVHDFVTKDPAFQVPGNFNPQAVNLAPEPVKEQIPEKDLDEKALTMISDEIKTSEDILINFTIGSKSYDWWKEGSLEKQATDSRGNLDVLLTDLINNLIKSLKNG